MVNAGAGDGFKVYPHDEAVLAWAQAAHDVAITVSQDPVTRAANLRHAKTWFVGVDALPNDADGGIAGVPLTGPWSKDVPPQDKWHRAQLSIVYPGYPKQDPNESDANHRYRITRKAAHVDGLLPIGAARRRFLREPHAFILGLPLNTSDASPLVVWPGSHKVMGDAFRAGIGADDPKDIDLTDIYHAARRRVFDQIDPVQLHAEPGQAMLLHRHLLHGVDVWQSGTTMPPEGRMIAYFRPEFSASEWRAP
ncbi:MAG: hypothetical protein WA790_12020 [Sulfitobacter sp.]